MQIKLELDHQQILDLLRQLPFSEWEQLKQEIESQRKSMHEGPSVSERPFGSMKGLIAYMADDFDAPLEDFKDYME